MGLLISMRLSKETSTLSITQGLNKRRVEASLL